MQLIDAGNNPQAKYDCCCSRCYRRGKQISKENALFEKSCAKTFVKNTPPVIEVRIFYMLGKFLINVSAYDVSDFI